VIECQQIRPSWNTSEWLPRPLPPNPSQPSKCNRARLSVSEMWNHTFPCLCPFLWISTGAVSFWIERITVALCASIGKSEKPRCFKKISVESLPVDYKFNRNAWMNSHLFEIWLKKVNRIMVKKQRNILMFIDNAHL
jgi:hypothetical protein